MSSFNYISKDAIISPCSLYRYQLRRCWATEQPPFVLGMLNPSTADADEDDPTITRSARRAASLGYGSLVVWNLYAFRATDPRKLLNVSDPIGPDNLDWVRKTLRECRRRDGIAVVGWGSKARDMTVISRAMSVVQNVGVDLHCLGVTKDGNPRHPLYVGYDVKLAPWRSSPIVPSAD